MKPVFPLFLLIFLSIPAFSQLQDDFSDGNFSDNPAWQGDSGLFTVTDETLQLFNEFPESTNLSYLSLPALTSIEEETTWEFYFRMEFAPSTSNFARIYLMASNGDLTGEQNGYFIKAGGISGSDDAIELYRQDGTSTNLLFSGTAGALGTAPAASRVRVIRSIDGQWSIYTDYSGGTDFQLEGTVSDDTYTMGNFFGFTCKYTSTRSEDFFFDDVFIDPIYEDTQAPQLVEANVVSATSLMLSFDENVDPATAENPGNYLIDNGIGNPLTATIDGQNPNMVLLETGVSFQNQVNYTITASNIEDVAGNIMTTASQEFTFFNIQPAEVNDVLITEIMADPFPKPEGLPEAEYLELYNNSEKVIQLSTLRLIVNSTVKELPEYLLLPGQYLIICDDEFLPEFSAFGEAVALGTLPALTNGLGRLWLANEDEDILFEVVYYDHWYRDSDKKSGGWSLEMIDLDNVYNCGGNWQASVDQNGGTPGQENSLLGTPLETEGPIMRSAYAESGFEVLITLNESVDEATISASSFSISDGVTIFGAFVQLPESNTVLLSLSTPLSNGIVYEVTASAEIADCLGNTLLEGNPVYFGVPETIEPNDIVVNEILFNPETYGTDFLEVYNRSNKIVDLDDLTLINFLKEDTAFLGRHLLFPGEYAVITEVASDIEERYFVEFPDNLVVNNLPGFDDKEGNITLKSGQVTIDSFDYNESMHFGLLSKKDGVSLERLSPETPTQSFGNWHSAASSAGYATPTYKNSQFTIPVEQGSSILSIPNTTFSPDNDGYEDILLINYETDQSGFFINLFIYDAMGRQITQLAANELLASQGVYKWDGTTEDGQKARVGIYVVWAELYNEDGQVEQFKETCVLAAQLD